MIQYSRKPLYLQLALALSVMLAGSGSCFAAQAEASTSEAAAQEAAVAAEAAAQHAAVARSEAAIRQAEIEHVVAANMSERIAEQEAQIAEAQRQVAEASRAMAEAARALEEQRRDQNGDMELARAELSRAHRALSEASREVAMAHRDAEISRRVATRVQTINLGDRAVIGVLLGEANERGITLAGVSPGGPAEEAGLKKGDILTSIRETDLTDMTEDEARTALLQTMTDVKPGEEIRIAYIRDGKDESLMVKAEQREPRSWQSLIRLPEPPPPAPGAPGAPGAPAAPGAPDSATVHAWTPGPDSARIVVDHIKVPNGNAKIVVIDDEALAERIAEIEHRVESFQYMFTDEDGTRIVFDEDFDTDNEELSVMGKSALNQANMWFGLSHTAGLELASLNPQLGEYFKAERGVLVLEVKDSNSYGLESGDVILSVAGTEVNSPAEMIRALRDIEPDAEFDMQIKRDRRDKTLKAVLPDNRLGALMGFHEMNRAPESRTESTHP
jgi:membrane-associated protease RseP (regulator of RpoE activity)